MAILRQRMRSGVVYYILLLLDENDRVSLPRVGEIKKRVYPARTDLVTREIHPPHATINFDEADNYDGLLTRFIAHTAGISETEANGHIDAFSNEIIAGLQEKGRVAVDHFGVFYLRENDILFAPDNEISNLGYAGLKKVPLPVPAVPTPAEPSAHTVETAQAMAAVAVATQGESIEGEKAKEQPVQTTRPSRRKPIDRRVVWLMGLFGFIFIIVAALAVINYITKEESSYPSSAFNRAPMPDPIVSPTSDDTMPDTNSAEPLPGEDTIMMTGNGLFKGFQPGSEVDEEQPLIVQQEDVSNADASRADAAIEVPSEETFPEEGTLGIEPDTQASVQSATTPVTGRECHVVVGAFGVDSNVRRMITRLEALGYSVDTMAKGSLTQVGVPAPCGTAEIERVLAELRSSVEAQAWILNK